MPTWEGTGSSRARSPAHPRATPLRQRRVRLMPAKPTREDKPARGRSGTRRRQPGLGNLRESPPCVPEKMDSPSDLFDDSSQPVRAFAPTLTSTDLHPQPGIGRSAPSFRPPGFPLIHHLLQPGGPRRILSVNRQREDDGATVRRVEEEMNGGEERPIEGGEDNLLQVKKRHGAEWSEDALKMKRMKLRDGEVEERDKRREGGREGRRREKEELKEQLEEARERLQLLQERVWKAFGEKHREEEEEKKAKQRNENSREGEGDEEMTEEDEEDITGGMYDEEDIGGQMEKETFSLLSASTFEDFHKQREDREGRMERGRGGRLEGGMEGMWMDCRELLRGDWNGWMEDEGEEGGQKFAQALKLELGSAVARVIDRVLRLYTEDDGPRSFLSSCQHLLSPTRFWTGWGQ
ncbi:hypothetical protein OJAV_G00182600 [Oryzias javanicus]|uniref:Uncharacterized protein n=1 Tax=Oryzias javanicus TaxID=123683 RepID=A0A3S2NVY8_ORYJA|nr:hypothetical protein OJAV_G00182600 [Oryzias javanicus]